MKKEKRQFLIKKVISENDVENQEQLMALLEQEGITTTQATISRDTRELNIVKTAEEDGKSTYKVLNSSLLQRSRLSNKEKLINAVSESVFELNQVEFLNILTALPGNGQSVAILIDNITFPEIVATVAGDDTIMIISKSKEDAQVVNDYFKQFVYL